MQIIIFLLTLIYNLIDLYRIYNFSKKLKIILKIILNLKQKLKELKKKKIKKGNLIFFYKNFKKISKYINIKSFYPLIISLLFLDSITLTESENNIHHYILNKNGELIEITNEQEKIRIENEKKLEENLKKQIENEDFEINVIITLIIIFFCIFGYFFFFPNNFNNDSEFDGYDLNDGQQRREFLKKHPEYRNEPIYTEYQKKWLGQEERLKRKTNPHYIGCKTGDKFHFFHFDAEYVDEYNEFIREWEDDNIYKSGRCWRENKKN
jgi:hypothetical protein